MKYILILTIISLLGCGGQSVNEFYQHPLTLCNGDCYEGE